MNMLGFKFLIALLALSAVWVFAARTTIKALRLADPGLYRAAANEIAGRRLAGRPDRDAPFLKMLLWMRRKWRHSDVRKHKAVRRWMYVHNGAHSALIALFGGLVLLLLH